MRSTTCSAVLFVAFVALVATQPLAARANTCKVDGSSCRTNQACCSGACVNGAPPGSKPFGVCCTRTTQCGGQCGILSDGCGGTLDCGPCPTTTTSTTTTSTTTTTAASCETSDIQCSETFCVHDSECPATRYCRTGSGLFDCEPKLTDGRACFIHNECFSGCCCDILGSEPGVCGEPFGCFVRGEECPGDVCGQDSDCVGFQNHLQYCTNGLCAQTVEDGAACSFSAGCMSGCCCSSDGLCQTEAFCMSAGGTCNP